MNRTPQYLDFQGWEGDPRRVAVATVDALQDKIARAISECGRVQRVVVATATLDSLMRHSHVIRGDGYRLRTTPRWPCCLALGQHTTGNKPIDQRPGSVPDVA
jgi:hypothetical protein